MNNARCLSAVCLSLLVFLFLRPAAVFAQMKPTPTKEEAEAAAYLREHYTKYEYRIPMRDGVKLFTAVYAPKDDSTAVSDPAHADAVQRQAVRGRSVSERAAGTAGSVRQGEVHLRVAGRARAVRLRGDVRATCGRTSPAKSGPTDIDESTDAYDTIDWLVQERAEQQRPRRA